MRFEGGKSLATLSLKSSGHPARAELAANERRAPARTVPRVAPNRKPTPERRLNPMRICPAQIGRTTQPLFPMLP